MTRLLFYSLVAAWFTMTACESSTEEPQPTSLEVKQVNNLFAPNDPGAFNMMGVFVATGYEPWRFFNLRTGLEVPRSDSNSTNWDIAFKATRIYVNSGASGPSTARALVLNQLFDEVTTAPSDDQLRTDVAPRVAPTDFAVVAQGNTMPPGPLGWYTTGQIAGAPAQATLITPTPGRTIVVRCTNGQFAKIQIQSYYQNAPDPATVTISTPSRYYTFRYVIAPVGSRELR